MPEDRLYDNTLLADTNRDNVVDAEELADWKKKQRRRKKKRGSSEFDPQNTALLYGFAADLVNSDPSLQEFFRWASEYINEYGRTPTRYEFDQKKVEIDWFQRYDSYQQEALKQKADPRTRVDYERSVEDKYSTISELAGQYGIQVPESDLRALAEEARFQNLTNSQIRARLRPLLERSIASGADLIGEAGDIQTSLSQWAARNGISIPDDSLRRLIASGAFGEQSLEDMKDELRRKYLKGAYPAWADEIEAGADPYDLAAPYRVTLASLLELNEEQIGLDDPMLGRAMQSGMTLTDLKTEIRNDPRWQTTDNAYETYASVGEDLLRMFGFR